jgi:hypothetical protein
MAASLSSRAAKIELHKEAQPRMARRKALELTMISSGEFLQVFFYCTLFVLGCGMEKHA